MDPRLMAALKLLTLADFRIMYGSSQLCDRLYMRYEEAKHQDALLLMVLSLTNDQQNELTRYLRVKLEQEVVEITDNYEKLHAFLGWLHNQAQSFYVKVLDRPAIEGGADFSVLTSRSCYDSFIQKPQYESAINS